MMATFELAFLTGWAPSETQQKPLRPGSAQARLADVLGVTEMGEDAKRLDRLGDCVRSAVGLETEL